MIDPLSSRDAASPQAPAAPAVARWDAHLGGALGFLLVCIAWILVRPYQGVRHDGILYLGQALHILWPDVLNQDVFFSHGSQDRFTLLTVPQAWLLSHFGTAQVEMALTAACNLAFIASAWVLCGALAPRRRWLCTASVVLLSHAYARLTDFNYAENFFTARSLAEPLVFLALAAWTRQRLVHGGILLALAALIHPLVAIPALVTAWILRVAQDRRWLWGLAVLVPIAALAAAGVWPFAGLFARFDDTWWDIVSRTDAQVRMLSWDAVDLTSAVLDLLLLGLAATALAAAGRRFVVSLLAASALLLAVALIGGDLARDVLVVQLQLWRVLWLAHSVAMLCLPVIVLERWREGGAARIVGAAALAAVLTVSWTLPYAWIFVAWLALSVLIQQRADSVSPSLARAALAGTVVAIVATTAVLAVSTYRFVLGDAVLGSVVQPAAALLSIPTLGALALLGLALLLALLPIWAAATLVVALLAACVPQWDQRSQWNRTVEAMPLGQHPFARFIPPSAQVYWHLELLPTWAMLGRASYASIHQGSGVVFNRATALEFAQRSKPMNALLNQQAACQMAVNAAGGTMECQPPQAWIEAFCKLAPAPDFMVFDARYSRGLVAQWDYRIERGTPPRTAFLYDCSKMR